MVCKISYIFAAFCVLTALNGGSGTRFLEINDVIIFMMKETEMYVSPEVEVLDMIAEGVLCVSGWVEDSDDVELF